MGIKSGWIREAEHPLDEFALTPEQLLNWLRDESNAGSLYTIPKVVAVILEQAIDSGDKKYLEGVLNKINNFDRIDSEEIRNITTLAGKYYSSLVELCKLLLVKRIVWAMMRDESKE